MNKEHRAIRVADDSKLARLLDQASVAPLLLEKNGVMFALHIVDIGQTGARAAYRQEEFRQALERSAGALAGVDTKALLDVLRSERGQDSHGRPD